MLFLLFFSPKAFGAKRNKRKGDFWPKLRGQKRLCAVMPSSNKQHGAGFLPPIAIGAYFYWAYYHVWLLFIKQSSYTTSTAKKGAIKCSATSQLSSKLVKRKFELHPVI